MDGFEIVFINAIKHGLGKQCYVTTLIPNCVYKWAKVHALSEDFVCKGIEAIEGYISECIKTKKSDGLGDNTDRANWHMFLAWLKNVHYKHKVVL